MADQARELQTSSSAAVKGLPVHLNFFWTASGNVAYALSQWGMIVALAKMTNSLMIGQFALGIAISTPILSFASMQLRSVQASDARREYHFSEYLGLQMLAALAAFCVIASIVFAGNYTVATKMVILAVAVAKSIEAVGFTFYGLFQVNGRLDQVGQSMMIKGLLSVAALGVGLYLTQDVFWAVVMLALGWLTSMLIFDVRRSLPFLMSFEKENALDGQKRYWLALRPSFVLHRHWSLAQLAFPLGMVMGLISLNLQMPRYFVHSYLGEAQLGIFSAMAYMTVGIVTLGDALGYSATPTLSRLYVRDEVINFRRLLSVLLISGVVLGLAGVSTAVLAGQWILRFAYGSEYASYANVFVWLMGAGAVAAVASVLTAAITSCRNFRLQVPMFALATGVNALICWWLVPVAGLKGGAVAILAASLVHVIFAGCVLLYLVQPHRRGAGAKECQSSDLLGVHS